MNGRKSERCLPKPPVPSLNDTLKRYKEYAEVVTEGTQRDIQGTLDAIDEFRNIGIIYQQRLEKIAEGEPNWINQFWLPEMYLRIRLPLPVTDAACILPQQYFRNHDDWLRYTALMIRGMVEYKDKIDTKQLKREVSTGKVKVKMCMQQYDRIFSCYRQPSREEDVQIVKEKRNSGNEHILVMFKDQAFVVHTRIGGRLLSFADVFFQLQQVIRMSEARKDHVVPVGAAAAGDRETAARFWEILCEDDVNRVSLTWAQEALFVVCLDDEDRDSIPPRTWPKTEDHERDVGLRGKHILTGGGSRGHGLNRWYDSTIQLVVGSSGTNGLCIEHSPAEGIVIAKMAENALRYERDMKKTLVAEICAVEREICAKPLTWHVDNAALELLEKQKATLDELTRELDLNPLVFKDFGKDFIKSMGFSPDGFIQLALQLAHFRLHGYLVSTYELASLRRFRAGRVDNIRANTREALAWVKAMTSDASGVRQETKLNLMRRAAEKQANVTLETTAGFGIDNHLCALSVIARQSLERGETRQLPKLFTDPMWHELMRFPLYTSQVHALSGFLDGYPCYGADDRDGYGCAYYILENLAFFALSAYKLSTRTNLSAFKDSIREALLDMKQLLIS